MVILAKILECLVEGGDSEYLRCKVLEALLRIYTSILTGLNCFKEQICLFSSSEVGGKPNH